MVTLVTFSKFTSTMQYKLILQVMKTIYPKIDGRILKENSTYVAVRTNNEIQIWLLGFVIDDLRNEPELHNSIPLENEDDLFAIFERFDEDMRCLIAEFNESQ